MTPQMPGRSRTLANQLGLANVELREGLIEELPIEDGWADVVISNGVINLCPDKLGVYKEIFRVLGPGGRLSVAMSAWSAQCPRRLCATSISGLVELLVPCRAQGARR